MIPRGYEDGAEFEAGMGGALSMVMMKTKSGRAVRIKTATVGQSFGTMAYIVAGRKRIWESRVYPYGMTGPAMEAAEQALERL